VSAREANRGTSPGQSTTTSGLNRSARRPRIVIVGAGFGGLQAARKLAKQPLDVLLIDRNNYHGFWPLLYQVATAELDASHIAQPVRQLLRNQPNLRFQLGTVQAIDRAARVVHTERNSYPYDELIVAAGSVSNFFGLDQIRQHGFDLKDLPETIALRNQLLGCFERASDESDPERAGQFLTFVIVGGGPTGVELAGAIAEMVRHVMRKDFPTLDFSQVRIVLVEMADRVLTPFDPELSLKAQQSLANLGVEFRFNTSVVGYENNRLCFKGGDTLPAETVVWAAGIQGNPIGASLGVPLQRGGRVLVAPTLQLPDDPNVWVIGDLSYLEGQQGNVLPQLATVAMQQGRHVAHNIVRKLRRKRLRRFRYIDKGSMATVGRHSAVAHAFGRNWSGPIAWVLWLVVHVYYLIGFRNKLMVLFSWVYNYLTYDRSTRAILTIAKEPITKERSDGAAAEPLAAKSVGAIPVK
jgi:NADH dehydrogenase